MKILFVGDIMGSAGRQAFLELAIPMKRERRVDVIIVNGENSASGKGITSKIAKQFLDAGADVITLGDHTYDQREVMPYLNEESRIIRPANFAPGTPGKGFVTVDTGAGKLNVVNLIGRVFLNPYDCPFRKADLILNQLPKNIPTFVDMHAEATSEKMAMGHYLAGRVSAVVGTHTHVQTSDERILQNHTAYLTDAGMTGSKDSIIGCEKDAVLKRFLTGLPARFEPAKDDVSLEGIIVTCEAHGGKATAVERLRIPFHG
ncbi:MAG: TIGR00282 family metallophosphoesterase [Verrucomicrobia bacterium]|nr:TIGR00282 family metallophosphoesterase [Verrucomicrobiota bacterium]MCH8511373.1 TIGR00282 family metallophosphoesterase [Kiritimatiellia bacterium]